MQLRLYVGLLLVVNAQTDNHFLPQDLYNETTSEPDGAKAARQALQRLMAEAFGSGASATRLLPGDQVPSTPSVPQGTKVVRRHNVVEGGESPPHKRKAKGVDIPQWMYATLNVDDLLPPMDRMASFDEDTQRVYRNHERTSIRRRKLFIDLARGKLDSHQYYQGVDPDTTEPHPVWPGWNPLFWRYQFALLLLSFIAVFCLELVFDFLWQSAAGNAREKVLQFSVRPSTVLRMGANCRVFTEASKISGICRCITCMFLHLHPFHLTTNCLLIYMTVAYVYDGVIGKTDQFVWVMHWVFPLFFFTGLAGSFYSLQTTLQSTGISIGASGGCLGLGVALLTVSIRAEGIPLERRVPFAYVGFTIFVSCVPFSKIFDSSSDLDMGAHVAGAVTGLFLGLLLNNYAGTGLAADIMIYGDRCSLGCLIAIVLAFAYVFWELSQRTPKLVIKAFEEWSGVTEKHPEKRLSAPGRIRTELLDAEERWELEKKQDCEDPEVVLRRFRDWMRWRRHTLGPGTQYGKPHDEQEQDVEKQAAANA